MVHTNKLVLLALACSLPFALAAAAFGQSASTGPPTPAISVAITVPDVADPESPRIGVGPGQFVHLHASAASTGATAATVAAASYHWTCDAGDFPDGADGADVVWQAPDSGPATIWVQADAMLLDASGAPLGQARAESVLTTIWLQILPPHVVFNNPVQTAWMYTGDPFNTRLVACICVNNSWACPMSGTRCDMSYPTTGWTFDNGDYFSSQPGSSLPPAVPGESLGYPPGNGYPTYTPTPWPACWARPTVLCWQVGFHQTTDPDSLKNRVYGYGANVPNPQTYYHTPPTTYLQNQWGENNRTYNTPGQHRLWAAFAVASGHPMCGTTIGGWEDATRIWIRDRSAYQAPSPAPPDNARRQAYIEWLSAYLHEPYEWGGSWVGGKDSNGAWVGGADGYQGYATRTVGWTLNFGCSKTGSVRLMLASATPRCSDSACSGIWPITVSPGAG